MGTARSRSPAVLQFGAGVVPSSTTVRYLFPGRDESEALSQIVALPSPRAGAIVSFRVLVTGTVADTTLITYTLMVDGVASAAVISMQASATAGANSNLIPISAGSKLAVRVTKAGAIPEPLRDVEAVVEVI